MTVGSDDVTLKKLTDPVDIRFRHLAVDVDVLGAGYDPDPVFSIIRDGVKLLGLFDRDHRIVLTMNEEYRLVYLLNHFNRSHLAKICIEENAPCQCNKDGEP